MVPQSTGKGFGIARISGKNLSVRLNNAQPNTYYSISVGYLKGAGCDGSWSTVGSVTTDQAGNGVAVTRFKMGSNPYMVELVDATGNVAFAAAFLSTT
jgi:hypothetical protein